MAFNFTGLAKAKKFDAKMALYLDKATKSQRLTVFAVEPPNEDDYDDEDKYNNALAKYEANPKFRGVVTDADGEFINVNFARSFVNMSFGKDKAGKDIDFDRYFGKYGNPSGCKTPKDAKFDLSDCVIYVTSAKKKDNTLATDKDGEPIVVNYYIGAPDSEDFKLVSDDERKKIEEELNELAEKTKTNSESGNDDDDNDDF